MWLADVLFLPFFFLVLLDPILDFMVGPRAAVSVCSGWSIILSGEILLFIQEKKIELGSSNLLYIPEGTQ